MKLSGRFLAGGGEILSSSASSSPVGSHSPAAALARICSAEVAPAITEAQPGCAARPPMAISRMETPRSAPQSMSASTVSSFSSVTRCDRVAILLPTGSSLPRRTLPVSIPLASGK